MTGIGVEKHSFHDLSHVSKQKHCRPLRALAPKMLINYK
jgi:hypothetical protein